MSDAQPPSTVETFPKARRWLPTASFREGSCASGLATQGIAGAASIVALGNLTSRVLGLVREAISASLFGATGLVSAFGVANTIFRQLYDLLIGGMLNSALVPVFAEYTALKQREELWRILSILLSLTVVLLSGIVLLLELLSPQLTWLIAGGFEAPNRAVTQTLVRIMLPSVLFLNLAGVVTGFLYASRRFLYPALGVAIYNAGIIAAMLLLSRRLDIYSLGVGVLGAAILQLLVQLPGLRGARLSFSLDLRHPALRRILALYSPIVLGLIVSLVQVTIDRRLATGTGESSIAWMDKATTLVQSAHGVVAVAISTAALPLLAQASARADWQSYRRTLGLSLRLSLVLIVPLVVALFILAGPLVAILFQHGEFTAHDTYWTALALRLYLLGLVFATIDWPLNYAFYARQDTLTPALVGILSVGVYLVVALLLLRPLGMLGLVLADSAKHFSHALTMLALTHRRLDGLRGQALPQTSAKAILASAVMGGIMLTLALALGRTIGAASLGARLLAVALPAVAGLLVYGGLAVWMRMEEALLLYAAIKQRLRNRVSGK